MQVPWSRKVMGIKLGVTLEMYGCGGTWKWYFNKLEEQNTKSHIKYIRLKRFLPQKTKQNTKSNKTHIKRDPKTICKYQILVPESLSPT